MIYINIHSGLGNQLFMYAAARSLALRRNTDLRLDLLYFTRSNSRSYTLDHYHTVAKKMTFLEAVIFRLRESIRYRLFGKVTSRIFLEKSNKFDPNIFELPNGSFIRGYYQSERYFEDYAAVIRKELTLKDEFLTGTEQWLEKIEDTQSVSLHVRRGDYLTDNRYITPISYFDIARRKIEENIDNATYFLFSDEPDWVLTNLEVNDRCVVVSGNGLADYQELYLMSMCKHNIITNSTFSWWGAWLNTYKNKIVIAPQKWFDTGETDVDTLPESWIKL